MSRLLTLAWPYGQRSAMAVSVPSIQRSVGLLGRARHHVPRLAARVVPRADVLEVLAVLVGALRHPYARLAHQLPPLIAAAASWMAFTWREYVPHRQMLPASSARICSSVGSPYFSMMYFATVNWPGVQMSTALRGVMLGVRLPPAGATFSSAAMPSDVSICLPWHSTTSVEQEQGRHAVDQHRARPAGAPVAHLLGTAGQAHGHEQRLAQRPVGLHLHLDLGAVDGERGALGHGCVRVLFSEVLDQRIVVGRLLTAQRAGVHEVRHRDGLRVRLGRRAEDRSYPQACGAGCEPGNAAHLEKVTARYVLNHAFLLLFPFCSRNARLRACARKRRNVAPSARHVLERPVCGPASTTLPSKRRLCLARRRYRLQGCGGITRWDDAGGSFHVGGPRNASRLLRPRNRRVTSRWKRGRQRGRKGRAGFR